MTPQPDAPPANPSEPPATGLKEPIRYYLIGWNAAGQLFACLDEDTTLLLFPDKEGAEDMLRVWKEMGTEGGVILPWPGVTNGRISDLPLSDREQLALVGFQNLAMMDIEDGAIRDEIERGLATLMMRGGGE